MRTPRRSFVTKTKCTCGTETTCLPGGGRLSSVIGHWHAVVSCRSGTGTAIYPAPGQQQALARVFGCARVVYNDCLRLRDQTYAGGEKISDTEVQRRVITLAKLTPERVWLGEVASVPLVQACQDARRAYRNWFDSLSGKRKGRTVGHPRFRSRKDHRQSIRLTRNGFALHGDRLYVAKVGDLTVRWSRPLPSVPSSVTVIREADGRYYASFVVEVAATPLPPSERDIGVDLGLSALAATSDGELITNPRHLRRRERQARPGAAGTVPHTERISEPGESPGEGGGAAPQGPRDAGRPPAQDSAPASPRQPSGLRRRPEHGRDEPQARTETGPGPAGRVPPQRGPRQSGPEPLGFRCRVGGARPAAGGQSRTVRAHGGQGGPLVPVQPALLSVRREGRP